MILKKFNEPCFGSSTIFYPLIVRGWTEILYTVDYKWLFSNTGILYGERGSVANRVD